MADREYFNERRKNRRLKFVDLLGGKCERCGSKDDLHFDHRRPKKKEFRIADNIDAPEDVLLKEVKKCILMCAPCHRDKTREKGEHGQPKSLHGTLHRYKQYGCRCGRCKKRMSEYNKERKAMAEIDQMIGDILKLAANPIAAWVRRYLKELKKKRIRIGDVIYEINEQGNIQYYSGQKGSDQQEAFSKWVAERQAAEKEEEDKLPKPQLQRLDHTETDKRYYKFQVNKIKDEALSLLNIISYLTKIESNHSKIEQSLIKLGNFLNREDWGQAFDSLRETSLLVPKEYHYLLLKIARAIVEMKRLTLNIPDEDSAGS